MKIALIYEFLTEQGGLEREIINHANFLKKEGHEVIILTCHKSKNIEKLLPFDNLKIKEISYIQTGNITLDILLCLLGINCLNKINPDMFISYSFPSNILIKNFSVKKIFYINHLPHFIYLRGKALNVWANNSERKISALFGVIFNGPLKRLDQRLVRSNNLLFVNSMFTKKQIDRLYGVKTVLSYPPIDPRIKIIPSKYKEKFIFTCGRIVPDKKYEWLIRSLSFVKNKLPVYLAGQGDTKYLNELQSLAEKLNVQLKFLGKLNTLELTKYYSATEVFAFPTPGEDFGLVPAESITCGTPCIIWGDGSGPTEQIIDGVNGFHARPYDLKDFAKKIDKCISIGLKIKNKKKILNSSKKFSAKVIKKNFLGHIKSILKN